MDTYDDASGHWRRLFRQNMWMATAEYDKASDTWKLQAIDHNGLTFTGEAPGDLTAEQALDRAEWLAP